MQPLQGRKLLLERMYTSHSEIPARADVITYMGLAPGELSIAGQRQAWPRHGKQCRKNAHEAADCTYEAKSMRSAAQDAGAQSQLSSRESPGARGDVRCLSALCDDLLLEVITRSASSSYATALQYRITELLEQCTCRCSGSLAQAIWQGVLV